MSPKRYILIIVSLWVTSICLSLIWNIGQYRNAARNEHLQAAKSFFQQIIVTRAWNAKHGGLYLRVSENVLPNPYLEVQDRDLQSSGGVELTKVNPAFMTRMISAMSEEQGDVRFHITSLNPINPINGSFAWERKPLQMFETGELKEYSEYSTEEDVRHFRYIAPLVTEKRCLQCHAKQGYEKGDIRGGISVSFPVQPRSYGVIFGSHILIIVGGLLLIVVFGNRIVLLTEKLRKQSHIDGLTQIANRKYFDLALHREWLRSRRQKSPLSVVMCDIDHFKLYNDTYGHMAGDECLKKVATALNTVVNRSTDIVARYGGEEFIIVLPDTPTDGGRVVAEMMQAAVLELGIPHINSRSGSYISASFGVSSMEETLVQEEDLLNMADIALYASKENGRNIVTHYGDL